MAYVIFDLDGTVINSEHRCVSKPDGSFCLDGWRANCTPEKIAKDSLLPLARSMRTLYRLGQTVIVCTSRVCQDADIQFLATHGLRYHHFISRDETDMREDGEYKTARLNELANRLGFTCVGDMNAIMYDDNLNVIQAMIAAKVRCSNAAILNQSLAKQGLGFQ